MKLLVGGREKMGDTDCLVVTLTNTENENDRITLWIGSALGAARKMEQILPAMGNARMTMTRE